MNDKTQQGNVTLTVENGVGTVSFFHPSHNSLPAKLLAKLAETITAAGQEEAVKVIVLRSVGERTFCAGASFDELASIKDEVTGKAFFMGFANVINACRKSPKLIIGRVQGKAVGGGVGLASAVDYCFATQFAAVKLSELAVGIGPFVVGPAVERKVGRSAMSQLAIDATNWQTAAWAKEKGLYAEVFESTAAMDAAIDALTQKLVASSPDAMHGLKQIFWEGTEHWDELLQTRAAMSGRLILSDFAQQVVGRFAVDNGK